MLENTQQNACKNLFLYKHSFRNKTTMKKISLLLMAFFALLSSSAYGQKLGVKTNLLYDATSTMNLGIEFSLAPKWTLDVSGNYNPWTFSDNKKTKHLLIQPEVRYWLCEKFNGHFFGLHAHLAEFNWGGMLPFGFKDGTMFGIRNETIINGRFEGWLAGAGISYGYHWILGNHWGLETTLGVGYAYLNYDKYPCGKCGSLMGTEQKNYFGPTKLGITLIYMIK